MLLAAIFIDDRAVPNDEMMGSLWSKKENVSSLHFLPKRKDVTIIRLAFKRFGLRAIDMWSSASVDW